MFMAAVFLDFGKAFDRTWHPGLLLWHICPMQELLNHRNSCAK
jgi:hypothetical protein